MYDYKTKKPIMDGANFSIVLPGGCNANCDFCFWKRSDDEHRFFHKSVREKLELLGDKVSQISITGGEPTMSPFFKDVMMILGGYKDKKIILTTNGYMLDECFGFIDGIVDHINISRHQMVDSLNIGVFGTNAVPNHNKLKALCEWSNSLGIDVTLSCVISPSCDDYEFFDDFVIFAKSVNASAVSFRSDYTADSLDKTPLENGLRMFGRESSCPVCVTTTYLHMGIPAHFKRSLKETHGHSDEIYELILHPDGNLYEDWDAKVPVLYEPCDDPCELVKESSSGGCDSSGCAVRSRIFSNKSCSRIRRC